MPRFPFLVGCLIITHMGNKRLFRSKTDQIIAGVCAGIANYFEIDPVIVRIVFVLFTLAGGGGVLLYILLWVVIPLEDSSSSSIEQTIKSNSSEIKAKVKNVTESWDQGKNRQVWAWFLICIGVFLLLSNLGAFALFRFDLIWPVIIVAIGVILIIKR